MPYNCTDGETEYEDHIKEINRHLMINQSGRYTHVCVLVFERYIHIYSSTKAVKTLKQFKLSRVAKIT